MALLPFSSPPPKWKAGTAANTIIPSGGTGVNLGVGTTTNITEKITLPNATYVGSVNAADSSAVKLIGLDSSNVIQLGATGNSVRFDGFAVLPNNNYLYSRNAANSTQLGLIGMDTSNNVSIAPNGSVSYFSGNVAVAGSTIDAAGIFQVNGGRSYFKGGGNNYSIGISRSAVATTRVFLGASADASPALVISNNAGTEIARVSDTALTLTQQATTSAGGIAGVGTQTLTSALYDQSRLQNLVTNGSGLLGNNYNFSSFTFSATETHGGAGSFLKNTASGSAFNDEFIPVDPEKYYRLVAWGKSGETGGTNYNASNVQYMGVAPYDIDGLIINPHFYSKVPGSTDTTLAVTLVDGATTMTLTDATGWHNGTSTFDRNFVWYGYTNSKGYTYPDYTYTRNDSNASDAVGAWGVGGISGNVITLTTPWAGGTIPAGTAVRNRSSGGSFKYIAALGVTVPNAWTRYEGFIGGYDTDADQDQDEFPYGTAQIKLLFLLNFHGAADNNIRWSDIWFSEMSSRNLETASSTVPGVVSTSAQTFAGVKTFSSDPLIPDEVYSASWNGSLEPATKNALYDKIETITAGSGIMEALAIAYATAL